MSYCRRFTAIFCIICIALVSGGCSSEQKTLKHSYSKPNKLFMCPAGLIDSNDKFSLYWDNELDCVLLEDNESHKIWSSIPYDFYQQEDSEGLASVRMQSPINIEYVDLENRSINTSYGSIDVLENGKTSSQRLKNGGIKVTYYFSDLDISIPVRYKLVDDGVEAAVLIKEIGEGEKPLYSVSLMPFFCATKADSKSWLFLPSGSGTLMYTDDNSRNERSVSLRLYGEELSQTIEESLSEEKTASLPVYGASNGNSGMMAVIENGSNLARIDAQAGNSEIGYASVYATFLLRGYDILRVSQMYSGYKALVRKTTDEMVETSVASVCYYPLTGNDATYSGMANKYRSMLFSDEKTVQKQPSLYLEFYGGTTVNKNLFGINYKKLKAATKFSDVKNILEKLNKSTDSSILVVLSGFGKSGLNNDEIGGGFGIGSAFGGKKQLNNLVDFCINNDILLSINYDILRFSKSGSGVSSLTDGVVTANGTKAKQYYFSKADYSPINKKDYFQLLKYDKITLLSDKLIKATEKFGMDVLSLNDFASISYSDYSNVAYYNKNNFSTIINSVLKSIKKSGSKIILKNPNDYAVKYTDYISESPVNSSKCDGFDKDIPFYQMVMHGKVPVAIENINLCSDVRMAFLYAVETGSSLSFAVSGQWVKDFENTNFDVFKYSNYTSWKNTIIEYSNEINDYLTKVSSATIVSHSDFDENISKTEFSNGIVVYVNYSDVSVNSPIGKIEPMGFVYQLKKAGEGI